MTGVKRHINLPAEDPALLRKYAAVLKEHEPAVDEMYVQRCLDKASALEANYAGRLTATSPVEDLLNHGVPRLVVNALKGQKINTVGELCERDADDLKDINMIGMGYVGMVCQALAASFMGLRPTSPK